MKKFCFSLEKVLDFKQQTWEVMKSELALLQHKRQVMDGQIEEMNTQFSAFNRQMQAEMQEGLSPRDIAVYQTYLGALNGRIQRLMSMRKQLSDVIDQKKQEILSVKSAISGLEKLREKQWEDYAHTAQKLQESAVEEFVGHARSLKTAAGE